MRCPNCLFNFKDTKDICPNCYFDVRDFKAQIGIKVSFPHLSYQELLSKEQSLTSKKTPNKKKRPYKDILKSISNFKPPQKTTVHLKESIQKEEKDKIVKEEDIKYRDKDNIKKESHAKKSTSNLDSLLSNINSESAIVLGKSEKEHNIEDTFKTIFNIALKADLNNFQSREKKIIKETSHKKKDHILLLFDTLISYTFDGNSLLDSYRKTKGGELDTKDIELSYQQFKKEIELKKRAKQIASQRDIKKELLQLSQASILVRSFSLLFDLLVIFIIGALITYIFMGHSYRELLYNYLITNSIPLWHLTPILFVFLRISFWLTVIYLPILKFLFGFLPSNIIFKTVIFNINDIKPASYFDLFIRSSLIFLSILSLSPLLVLLKKISLADKISNTCLFYQKDIDNLLTQ